jgi:tetratricopeptide (TPR) repeat protein
MAPKTFSDSTSFNTYLSNTDDCMQALMDYYPPNAEGKVTYAPETKQQQPAWKNWGLMEAESKQWSLFRKQNNELHTKLVAAKGAEQKKLQEQLDKNQADFWAYYKKQDILQRLVRSGQITDMQREIMGVSQDVIEHKTALRTITLKYEKEIGLTKFEKEYIEKYVALHNEVPVRSQKLCSEIKKLHDAIPELWPKMWIAKEKADKAGNVICMPPPEMKGDWSPIVQMYIPTLEEQQVLVDDCNAYFTQFSEDINKISEPSDALYAQVYDDEEEDDDDENPKTLFGEVHKMESELVHHWVKYTILPDDDWQEFLEKYSDENKKVTEAWENFIDEYNAFMDVYTALVDFLNERNKRREEQAEDVSTPDVAADETDDHHAETIQKYESPMGATAYFDVLDWHIIMDHYQNNHDEKTVALILEKAFVQHPENATLLLRKAGEEAGKHEYQKALALIKRAEELETEHHPNLYLIKANIYCQMHVPDNAIPLYNKLINAKGPGLEWFHERARTLLIDIYDEKGQYNECMRLAKELTEMYPKDGSYVANLAYYYLLNGKIKESEEVLLNFLKEFPENDTCLEQLGHHYTDTKEYEKAVKQFELAYETDRNENYDNLSNKGNALIELAKSNERTAAIYYKSAVICFETCVFHYRFGKEYHLSAALCYTQLKMPYAAAHHYRQVLLIDPGCPEALQKLQALNVVHLPPNIN